MKLGSFAILRVAMFLLPEGFQYWANLMMLLATAGIVYGVFVGLAQTGPEIRHRVLVGVPHGHVSAWVWPPAPWTASTARVFQMFAHGIMTALFFSSGGLHL